LDNKTRFVIFVILLLFIKTTADRNDVWQSERLLWEDIIAKSPNKPRGHLNLGLIYHRGGEFDRAASEFLKTYELGDDVPRFFYKSSALSNIAVLFIQQGRFDEAERLLARLMRERPSPNVASNLAVVMMRQGRLREAEDLLTAQLAEFPNDPNILFNRAEVYRTTSRCVEAERDYLAAWRESPDARPRPCDAP